MAWSKERAKAARKREREHAPECDTEVNVCYCPREDRGDLLDCLAAFGEFCNEDRKRREALVKHIYHALEETLMTEKAIKSGLSKILRRTAEKWQGQVSKDALLDLTVFEVRRYLEALNAASGYLYGPFELRWSKDKKASIEVFSRHRDLIVVDVSDLMFIEPKKG